MYEFQSDIATLQGNRNIQGNRITQNYSFLHQKMMQRKLHYLKKIVRLLFFFFFNVLHYCDLNLVLSSGSPRVPTESARGWE